MSSPAETPQVHQKRLNRPAESFLTIICPNVPERFANVNDEIFNAIIDVFETLNPGLKCIIYYDTQRLQGYPNRTAILRVLKSFIASNGKESLRMLTVGEAGQVNVEIADEIRRISKYPFYADFFSYPAPPQLAEAS